MGLGLVFIVTGLVLAAAVVVYQWIHKNSNPNPFSVDLRRPPQPFVADHKVRDVRIKAAFKPSAVQDKAFDVICIGSGIGGLSAAATLARAGKKVLILEQHDQAGGCCHTFVDKGFEFDTGIHYIGEMRNNTLLKFYLDQISDGQIEWASLHDEYDHVQIGDQPRIPIRSGREALRAGLLKRFPSEEKAIDKYFEMLKESRKHMQGFVMLKFMPFFFAKLLIKTGLVRYFTQYFTFASRSVASVLSELTDNKDLQVTLSYCWGDYGTQPTKASFAMHATLVNHFMNGVSYPRGGASEFAFHIIPVIQRAGGQVLVRATVTEVIVEAGKAVGVKVTRGQDTHEIRAPVILSDAGVFNTFERLIPQSVKTSRSHLAHVQHGVGAMSIYIGLNGTKEELGLQATNVWAFTNTDFEAAYDEYLRTPVSKLGTLDIPLLFVSFPSTKDPEWAAQYPGKTTCEIVTLADYAWFEQWEDKRVMKRGDDYEELKNRIGRRAWKQVCTMFPQLEDKVEYFNCGSPLTNKHYIQAPRGEIYGADHTVERFSPDAVVELRPETSIDGLFLTGQDVFSCGFAGAMFGGLLCAGRVLNRNLVVDLMKLHKRTKKQV